jgi:hypothetical protein
MHGQTDRYALRGHSYRPILHKGGDKNRCAIKIYELNWVYLKEDIVHITTNFEMVISLIWSKKCIDTQIAWNGWGEGQIIYKLLVFDGHKLRCPQSKMITYLLSKLWS